MDSKEINALVAENGLRVELDSIKGKRTVAVREFKRGDTILSIRPLYEFPARGNEESTESRCTHCFARLPKRRPRCSQCRQTQYCSINCQTAHWTSRHYFECMKMDERAVDAACMELKPEFRPSLRMCVGVMRTMSFQTVPAWLRVQREAWHMLVTHRDKHPQFVLTQYEEIARVINAHRSDIGLDSTSDAIDVLCRSGCNNFAAYEPNGPRMSGYLCSPLVSVLLNHSCLPNAAFVHMGGMQIVRALDDVQIGDEITLAYMDGLQPRDVRQKQLSAVYFFDCTCDKCCGESARAQVDVLMSRALGVDGQMPEYLPTDYVQPPAIEPWVLRVIDMLLAHFQDGGTRDGFDQGLLDCVGSLPPRNFSFAAYTHWLECQDDCLERISSDRVPSNVRAWACVSAMYVLAFYACVYPPYLSLVGFQCLEASKLVWNTLVASEMSNEIPNEWVELGLSLDRVKRLARCAQNILRVSAEPSVSAEGDLSVESQVALLAGQSFVN
ncbi:hypothetical protein IW136_005350 [Coemansia sp. RSA 678]|nr:hypothetical protein IW136_005350 [Coemansia sp. RSA 678]